MYHGEVKKQPWKKSKFQGVEYREHPSRRFQNRPDRYFRIRYRVAGKSRTESIGWGSHGWTPKKASETRTEIMRNLRKGQGPQSLSEAREMESARLEREAEELRRQEKENRTVGDLAGEFLQWAEANKKDGAKDRRRYELYVKPELEGMRARDVSPFHLERMKATMQRNGLSPKTVHHALSLVRTIYRKARVWNLYDGDIPTDGVTWPKFDNRRVRFLSHEEADRLLNRVRESSEDLYRQSILALHCGLRFGEIAALTWGAVDFKNGVIHVMDPKSGENREAYITEPVRNALEEAEPKKADHGRLVFPSRSGGRIKQVSTTFNRICNELFNQNVSDRRQRVSFHSLRHSFCSWLALQGVSLYEIAELAGHKNIEMTKRYSHLLPESKRKAVEGLSEAFKEHHSGERKIIPIDPAKRKEKC